MTRAKLAKITEPPVDVRVWRQVIAYRDRSVVNEDGPIGGTAIDLLECGHMFNCSRTPGGRKVVAHAEPCGTCTVDAP